MSIKISLPDNSVRTYESEITGYDLAFDIGTNLGKDAICIEINGVLSDLHHKIDTDAKCKIYCKEIYNMLHTLQRDTQ